MTQAHLRHYQTAARSTETFGRVLVNARDQHLVVDGPVSNGCPGEAITPAELFLSGVAACGVELIQVLARELDVPLRSVRAAVQATQDPSAPVRTDVNVFNTVRIDLEFGASEGSQQVREKAHQVVVAVIEGEPPDPRVSVPLMEVGEPVSEHGGLAEAGRC